MLSDILLFCKESRANMDKKYSKIFLSPYYIFVEKKIMNLFLSMNGGFSDHIIEDVVYQVVEYAHNHYLKYAYFYEFKLAKDAGLLEGVTEEERNNYYIENLSSDKEWIIYFFEKYPKLLNLLDSYTSQILSYLSDFLKRIISDNDVLDRKFQLKDTHIEKIILFLGDLHNGKCVSALQFFNGQKIYYKPRSASNEIFLCDFLNYLNNNGLCIRLRVPSYIDCISYSWHLHVEYETMQNKDDISEYFDNLGRIQCLFYLIGAQDIIPDNILCIGNCPYIIDCESLIMKQCKYLDGDMITEYLQNSVLRTGILPDWMFNGANERTQISSLLFKFSGKNTHLPMIDGEAISITSETLSNFVEGFCLTYDFFSHNKPLIYKYFQTFDFSSVRTRILLHPTVIYTFLFREFITPPYLHGEKDIEDLIASIVKFETYGENTKVLIDSIKSQLEEGNIPYYYIDVNGDSLMSLPCNVVAPKWIPKEQTSIQPILHRVSSLSKSDLSIQVNLIKETINFFLDVTDDKRHIIKKIIPYNGMSNDIEKNEVLIAINKLESMISDRMLEFGDEIGFVSRTRNIYDARFQICLMNNSIYDGMAGICLFYRTLYDYSLNPRHLNISKKIQKTICKNYRKDLQNLENDFEIQDIPLAPLSGITSLLYLMELYPDDFYEESLYQYIVKKVKSMIPYTIQYDYMSGLAGLILFVSKSNLMDENDKSFIIKYSGERLLQLAQTNSDNMLCWTYLDGNKATGKDEMILGGFAHGSASVAAAFLHAYLYVKDKNFLIAFKKALRHDRSFYSEALQGWYDGRDKQRKHDSGSWCHGAAGIALSRLIITSLGYKDELIDRELGIAKIKVRDRLGGNLCICHGTLGNIEILKAILGALNENDDITIPWVQSIIKHINSGEDIVCGDDNVNSQIGLYMGISGIGYQLLRFLDWKKVPSIMGLEINSSIPYLH